MILRPELLRLWLMPMRRVRVKQLAAHGRACSDGVSSRRLTACARLDIPAAAAGGDLTMSDSGSAVNAAAG